MDKDPGIYVRHILDAITNIEMDTAGYDFEKELKPFKDAVERIGKSIDANRNQLRKSGD